MPEQSANWVLIFSDGTGQRGVRDDTATKVDGGLVVKNTNVFQMYAAIADDTRFRTFYDAGLGAPEEGDMSWPRSARNLWSKATGWGITANIVDCYEALMIRWTPGMKIGLFGFSRGAYTVRCLGGVLSTCGLATSTGTGPISKDRSGPGAERRRKVAEEAVAAYKKRDGSERKAAGGVFAALYQAAQVVPDAIGVFDTVKSLGLPGVMDIVNPYKHEFHDNELSSRVAVGLQALSIDENRKAFLPVPWSNAPTTPGQTIEQCWFPGVHSDIGGGYDDDNRLADFTLAWMIDRLDRLAGLKFPIKVKSEGCLLGKGHDERTGLGVFWLSAERTIEGKSVDIAPLCASIEERFENLVPSYRPKPLRHHPRVAHYGDT